ncbi:MAG TPA: SsrA-binding protein SmpB [Phycisphaerae bacterium]|nr:SsrA-binding protein SmpB [Phycisphaerae bacterium]
MAKKNKKSKATDPPSGHNAPRVTNRKAYRDYHIVEKVECGIVLTGTEVKSLRQGGGKIDEAYARLDSGELFLVGATIAPYVQAAEGMQHDPTAKRKLLLHRKQIHQLEVHVKQKGKTLIPLTLFFKKGWAKCEIGVAVGKRDYDKRDDIRKRDQKRDMDRAMRRK